MCNQMICENCGGLVYENDKRLRAGTLTAKIEWDDTEVDLEWIWLSTDYNNGFLMEEDVVWPSSFGFFANFH